MRGRSDRAIGRMSTTTATRAGSSLLALAIGGCFGDAPALDETSSGSTTSGSSSATTGDTTTDTGTDPTLADTSTTSSSESSSSGTDTGEVEPTFFDDFNRKPSQAIGNAWVEKLPSVFSIADEMVVAGSNLSQEYYDQVVYQDEPIADIELRVEFRVDVAHGLNEPHLIARQQDDALLSGSYNHCYVLVPQIRDKLERLCLMRFDSGPGIGAERCTDWPGADFILGDWYRLVMTVEDPGPVQLTGVLQHATDDGWMDVVAVEWEDNDDVLQIDGPGVWGFSGGTSGTYYNNFVFDNFSAYYR